MSSWSPWEDANYCWVVVCKNKHVHRHANTAFAYKIPLGETDAISEKPNFSAPFLVHCPDCGEQFSYSADEVLKVESVVLDSFTPHPLFQDT